MKKSMGTIFACILEQLHGNTRYADTDAVCGLREHGFTLDVFFSLRNIAEFQMRLIYDMTLKINNTVLTL